MTDYHVRTRRFLCPVCPEGGKIAHPVVKVSDVTGNCVSPKPPRTALTAPIDPGGEPAAVPPVGEGFEVFFVEVTAPREKQ